VGAAAAVVAPLLRPGKASALGINKTRFNGKAPVITVFDHRGCSAHVNKEYKGPKTNDEDDEMCVKVALAPIAASEGRAAKQLSESISFKSKGIDGDYTGSA